MLNWSDAAYQFTLGLGSLAVVAMLAEATDELLPAWAAVAIAVLPLGLFVMLRPGELPAKVVRTAHVIAAIWYVSTAVGLLVASIHAGDPPLSWLLWGALAATGCVPCVLVFVGVLRGTYGEPSASDDSPW